MIDYHIHIGQFYEIYYDAHKIFSIIESLSNQTNITKVLYSSTSSCRDDAKLSLVEEEIFYAQNYKSSEKNFSVEPYLWFIPKYSEQGISIESATKAFNYCGIKLHPGGQNWDLEKKAHTKSFHQIFQWANDFNKFILIHCGTQKCDLPNRFEFFFKEYPKAKVILAHSNPINKTAEMVNKYENVYCDTACLKRENLEILKKQIIKPAKILFGSDFPINNYFNKNLFDKNTSLTEQYTQDTSIKNLLIQ